MLFDFPLGKEPRATRDEYLKLACDIRNQRFPEIDAYEQQIGQVIPIDWFDELALHTQIVIKRTPLCYAHGRVLYTTLSSYLINYPSSSSEEHIVIWETGTARGFSALCMAKALQDFKRSGTIITFDVLPHDQPIYWNCIDDLEGPKSRAQLLKPWKELTKNYIVFHQGDTRIELPKVRSDRIHFAFLDGAHSYEDVMWEFSQIREYQRSGDIIVYDDYTQDHFPGLVRAVDEICELNGYIPTVLRASKNRGYVVAKKG